MIRHMDAAHHKDSFLSFDLPHGFRDKLPFSGRDSARFQRAA